MPPSHSDTSQVPGAVALFSQYSFGYFRAPNSYNVSYADFPIGSDASIEKAFNDQAKVINVDFAACDTIIKNVIPYILGQAFLVPPPRPLVQRIWHPWIKDYYGESATKLWLQYVWVDRNLKEQMTGSR